MKLINFKDLIDRRYGCVEYLAKFLSFCKVDFLKNKLTIKKWGDIVSNLDNSILPPMGMGDILYILLCLRSKGKKYNNIFITKNYFYDLISLFPDVVENAVLINESDMFLFDKAKFTFKDIYCQKKETLFLKLFMNAIGGQISHFNGCITENDDYFAKRSIPKDKVVLFCPEATTCEKEISEQYWILYANKISALGYYPIFNSSRQYGIYPSVFWDIKSTIALANYSVAVIGYRSGLLDVLAYFSNVNFIVFYPKKPSDFHARYISDYFTNRSQKYMNFCSLKTLHVIDNIREYIFDEKCFPLLNN